MQTMTELQQAASAVTARIASCDGSSKQTLLPLSSREFDCLMAVWGTNEEPSRTMLAQLAQRLVIPLQRVQRFFQNQRATRKLNHKRKAIAMQGEPHGATPAKSARASEDHASGTLRSPATAQLSPTAHDVRLATNYALGLLSRGNACVPGAAAAALSSPAAAAPYAWDSASARGPAAAASPDRDQLHQMAKLEASVAAAAALASSTSGTECAPMATLAAEPSPRPTPAAMIIAAAAPKPPPESVAAVQLGAARARAASGPPPAAPVPDEDLADKLQSLLSIASASPASAAAAVAPPVLPAGHTWLEHFSDWLWQRGLDPFSCAWRCSSALAKLVEVWGRKNSPTLLTACACVLQCAFSQCALTQPMSLEHWQQLLAHVDSAAAVCRRSDLLWLQLRKNKSGPHFALSAPDKAREETLTATALVAAIAPHHATMIKLVSTCRCTCTWMRADACCSRSPSVCMCVCVCAVHVCVSGTLLRPICLRARSSACSTWLRTWRCRRF